MSRRRSATRTAAALSLAGATALAFGLTACAGGADSASADNGGIRIVASTSTWGDIAQQVIDDADDAADADGATDAEDITVDTILSGTDDDPHEYEATARDISTIRDADIVVGNGAGYDNWLTDNAGDDAEVITAAPVAEGHDHGDHSDHSADSDDADHDHGSGILEGEDNPHVWFDMDRVTEFADSLAAHLNSLDDNFPAEATGVHEMTDRFRQRIADLPHSHVVLTEPVAGLLLRGSEVHDVTPEGFARAVLNEGEPSVADLSATRDLITDGEADALITNTQSESQASRQLTDAAEDKDLPVVNVTETPGNDEDFADYVDAAITDLEDALG
ncbi:metal ABC transporter solute-binding protein, Zn/Mn family [Corynebacterium glyciniphilum]|uniref:metal ABC transporter solute-binding protein, Zn/Mn family n=1 Tax=Corynebacterium glyciniphilum TaxID=1404244 RepID=UPI002655669F|nr:zinc ABC transporter substrate-binding protein [Corynebacterium glyciniphilum]MDN5682472.1 zinc ABC transporter substrate-binding protein [Corynebacterium glyciniphilum]